MKRRGMGIARRFLRDGGHCPPHANCQRTPARTPHQNYRWLPLNTSRNREGNSLAPLMIARYDSEISPIQCLFWKFQRRPGHASRRRRLASRRADGGRGERGRRRKSGRIMRRGRRRPGATPTDRCNWRCGASNTAFKPNALNTWPWRCCAIRATPRRARLAGTGRISRQVASARGRHRKAEGRRRALGHRPAISRQAPNTRATTPKRNGSWRSGARNTT